MLLYHPHFRYVGILPLGRISRLIDECFAAECDPTSKCSGDLRRALAFRKWQRRILGETYSFDTVNENILIDFTKYFNTANEFLNDLPAGFSFPDGPLREVRLLVDGRIAGAAMP